MSPSRITIILGIILAVFIVADVAVHLDTTEDQTQLPSSNSFEIAKARTVTVTHGDDVVRLERLGDGAKWALTAPLTGPADSAAIREMLKRFRRGIPMQVALGSGNLKEYGLASGSAVRLQITSDAADEPVVDLYIGADTAGGASFVRFPNSEQVYRAQVGGQRRLLRPARDWRDPSILSFQPDAVVGFRLAVGAEQRLSFSKGEAWSIAEDPSFPVDEQTVTEVLSRLGGLRAGRVLPADFPIASEPVLVVDVELAGLDPITASFFVEQGVAYVRRTGRDEVFQVAASVPSRLALPLGAWRDRQFLNIDRPSILKMTYHDGQNGNYILEQLADSSWKMVEPANVDVNLRDATQAALRLSALRAEGLADISPEVAGFPSPNWIDISMRDGSEHRLELGARLPKSEIPRLFIRTPDQPNRIGVMRIKDLLEIRKGWSR